jgi:hypothetical protein
MYESACPSQEEFLGHLARNTRLWDTLLLSRPEGKALRGRTLSAEPEAVMCTGLLARRVRCAGNHHCTKAKNPGVWGNAPDLEIDTLLIKESRPCARAVGFVRSHIFADAEQSGRSIFVAGFAFTERLVPLTD